jgi:hypothetical protein
MKVFELRYALRGQQGQEITREIVFVAAAKEDTARRSAVDLVAKRHDSRITKPVIDEISCRYVCTLNLLVRTPIQFPAAEFD